MIPSLIYIRKKLGAVLVVFVVFFAGGGWVSAADNPDEPSRSFAHAGRSDLIFPKFSTECLAVTGESLVWVKPFQIESKRGPKGNASLVLESPDVSLDRAVSFSCQLLEQSDTGKLHVCDIFRWQDLWSRNPDSGFGPSLVLAGKLNGAARDLLIDMNRCERASSAALKTTGDASQGGSVEGVTWLSDHLRRYKPEA